MIQRQSTHIERLFLHTPLSVRSLTQLLKTEESPITNPHVEVLRRQGMQITYQCKTSDGFAHVRTARNLEPAYLHEQVQETLALTPQSTLSLYATHSNLMDLRTFTRQLTAHSIGWYVLATTKHAANPLLEYEFVLGVHPPKRFDHGREWPRIAPELFKKTA